MKQLIFILASVFFILPNYCQTVDGNFNTNINYPDYVISIAINMQSGSGSAAVVTLEFTYNATDLSFPSEPVKGTDYFLNGGFDSYPTQNITSVKILKNIDYSFRTLPV